MLPPKRHHRHTGVVRLHPLQRVHERSAPLEVKLARLGDDRAFHSIPRPEGVAHRAPRLLRVGAKGGGAILADLEARRRPREGQIDDAVFVDGRLDRVLRAVLGQGDGNIIGVEGKPAVVEAVVLQSIGRPQGRLLAVGVEYLGVELACDANAAGRPVSITRRSNAGWASISRDIAIDHLSHGQMSGFGHDVERLRLDAGGLQRRPSQVLLPELGVGHAAALFRDGGNGGSAVDGFLGARDICKSAGRGPVVSNGASRPKTRGRCETHCCFAQLNILLV